MLSILTIGVIVFAISSLVFYFGVKKSFNSAFLVSIITLVSYVIMAQGGFVVNDIYWTRWVFYGLSCPLLAYEISRLIGLDGPKRIFNMRLF
jgi:hypothetical protein